MDLNKTETKFMRDLLMKQIHQSNEVIESSMKNFLDPNLPYYVEDSYKKIEKKQKGIINRCNSILNKLN